MTRRRGAFGLIGAAAVASLIAVNAPRASDAIVIRGDSIEAPLLGVRGDAERGRAIIANRQVGLCLLCHTGPFPEERFQGSIAPSLAGVGGRLSEGQIRLRIVDASRVNSDTVMPPYYRSIGLNRVSANFRDKPILSAQQIEDVVAFLTKLRD